MTNIKDICQSKPLKSIKKKHKRVKKQINSQNNEYLKPAYGPVFTVASLPPVSFSFKERLKGQIWSSKV